MTSDQSLDYFTTDLYVMGDNKESQCGIDNQDYINKLTKINLPMVIREIACGLEHTLIVTNEGLVYAFGSNLKGQLGVENIAVAWNKRFELHKDSSWRIPFLLIDRDENQAYQWGNNILKPQFIRQASNIKCGLNFTILQDDSLYLYKNQVLQPLKIKSQISEFACSAYNLFYMDDNNTLYLHPETNGYHLSLLTDENKLYYYLDKQLIQVNVQPNKIDSSFGKELAIVLDDNNKAIIINLKTQQQKQQELVFHSISSGVNHLILIGNITKGQIQNQELEESVQIGEDEEDDDSILEGDGMSPITTQKTQQDQLMNTQQNNTFSFSIRKDLQLFNSIKTNHKETQTDDNLYAKLKNENEELRTILLQQRKNLEIQIQFQKTLQDQMSRLTQENHLLKLGQNKNQLLNLIKQKEQNLKNLIDEFYQKQREFLQNKK
ncbi:unnamed protein product (macronuclear) [Paramecium tetraurelia]|uniref:Regulator of chromosome condensation n=1 Tax=Paramecium tetraurelia TaxID=5888 RepID=A0BCE0_PARTE|nr:uncharacterized protein GSPATT00004301001 [Paramecium tetraurelia]CAK56207.1 unnamed protein product [Paramecium tetraurelia]|eukprot:XP_001423605.1 hypothetical protein (macronuclear) [Paramecium tetraurelia strain d4-2]